MENLIHTKLVDKSKVLKTEVATGIMALSKEVGKFDIIFLDPPYNKNLIQETLNYIINSDIIKQNTIIIAERDVDDILPEEVGNLRLIRNQKYGDTILSFYSCNADEGQ